MYNERKYYRVTHGIAYDAIMAYREKCHAVEGVCWDYSKRVGGIGFFEGSAANVGNGVAINAVIFEGSAPAGWKKSHSSYQAKLDRGKTACRPDKRTKAGQQFEAEIKAIERAPCADVICEAIGAPTSISYKYKDGHGNASFGFWSACSPAWCGDDLYLALPDYEAAWARYEADGKTVTTPRWTVPDGMTEILKEEMDLDFARAKLAESA